MKKLLILASVTFVILFTIGIWIMPLALSPQVVRVKPKIYYLPNDPPLKVIVSSSSSKGYICYQFWFYWNHDGPTQNYSDWEPVYVYYCDGSLYALAYRVHWNWLVVQSKDIQVEGNRPVIVFYNPYHTPSNSITDFRGYVSENYVLEYEVTVPEASKPTSSWTVLSEAPDRSDMLYTRGFIFGISGFASVMGIGLLYIKVKGD